MIPRTACNHWLQHWVGRHLRRKHCGGLWTSLSGKLMSWRTTRNSQHFLTAIDTTGSSRCQLWRKSGTNAVSPHRVKHAAPQPISLIKRRPMIEQTVCPKSRGESPVPR